jgi:Protein of unknown function (DUF1569)
MSKLHDAEVRESIKARVKALRPNSIRKWGAMTVDQMLWHVASGLELSMGLLEPKGENPSPPLPKPLIRFIVLNLPWPKSVPTMQAVIASKQYDLEAERSRCLKLIDEFAARPLDGPWPLHPVMGTLTGEQYSRLMAKHLNHHLTQFSA